MNTMINQDGNWQQDADGLWSQAVPLPFYGIRKMCQCGAKFWKLDSYIKHFQQRHTDGVRYRRTPDGMIAEDRKLA